MNFSNVDKTFFLRVPAFFRLLDWHCTYVEPSQRQKIRRAESGAGYDTSDNIRFHR